MSSENPLIRHAPRVLAFLGCAIVLATSATAADSTWPKISIGTYTGYADTFIVKKGQLILDNGCEILGGECELVTSQKGITLNGDFYPWDAPGLQASRDTDSRKPQYITIRGRAGAVIVVDHITKDSDGKEIGIVRMCIAPKAE